VWQSAKQTTGVAATQCGGATPAWCRHHQGPTITRRSSSAIFRRKEPLCGSCSPSPLRQEQALLPPPSPPLPCTRGVAMERVRGGPAPPRIRGGSRPLLRTPVFLMSRFCFTQESNENFNLRNVHSTRTGVIATAQQVLPTP
jgi:hypothetical protein